MNWWECSNRLARWRRPRHDEEAAELERTAEELDLPLEALCKAMQNGRLVDLDGYTWCTLDNADVAFSLAEAERIAAGHGRDAESISRAIVTGKLMPAPIILDREEHQAYLVAGNTRLMVCRGLSITPKVWRIKVNGV